MTLSNVTNRTSATGAGAVLVIPYLFPTTASGDLTVIKRTISTGAETTLVENASSDGYTSTYSRAGGTVTTSDSITTSFTVHVIRSTPFTQALDLEQGGSYNAENIETAFDKAHKLTIQNKDALDNKAIRFPETDSALTTELPALASRVSKVVSCDSSGNITMIDAVPTGSVSFSTFGTNMAEAANALAAKSVINLDHVFDIRDYGATTASADNSTEIQAALDAADTAGGGTVYFPAGVWTFATQLDRPRGVNIRGEGIGDNNDKTTQLVYTGTANGISSNYAEGIVDQSTISDFDMLCSSTATAGIFVENAQQLRIHDVQVDNWTNNGNYGIHLAGGSHWVQIIDCQCWGRVYGIFSERSDTGTNIRNNATQFDRCNVLGDTAFIYMDNIHGSVIHQVEVNQLIDPSLGIIVFNNCSHCSITEGYFEPVVGQTAPMILFRGTSNGTVNSRIINNWIGVSGSSSTAVIVFSGTGGRNMIANNTFTGNIDTIWSVANDYPTSSVVDIFANNTMPDILLTNGKPPIIGSGRYHVEHKGWFSGIFQEIDTLGDNATPTVLDKNIWLSGGTTTVTDFDDGVLGQTITVIAEHPLTITDGTNIFLRDSINWKMLSGDTLTLIQKADTFWYETSRSNNTSFRVMSPIVCNENAVVCNENTVVVN